MSRGSRKIPPNGTRRLWLSSVSIFSGAANKHLRLQNKRLLLPRFGSDSVVFQRIHTPASQNFPVLHRKHAGAEKAHAAHELAHSLFLVPGAGPHPGIPGNYLFGSVLQTGTQAAPGAWAVQVHDSDDGAAVFQRIVTEGSSACEPESSMTIVFARASAGQIMVSAAPKKKADATEHR